MGCKPKYEVIRNVILTKQCDLKKCDINSPIEISVSVLLLVLVVPTLKNSPLQTWENQISSILSSPSMIEQDNL
jgi:hypothetical protein